MANCEVRLRNVPPVTKVIGRGGTVTQDFAVPGGVLEQDLSDVIVQVTACAIREQEQLGNPLHNFVINNRPGRSIREVDIRSYSPKARVKGELVWKTEAFFGDAQRMVEAAQVAYRKLFNLTRVGSGAGPRARTEYLIYVGRSNDLDSPGNYYGTGYGAIHRAGKDLDGGSSISILGPNVIYGRKLYWNPKGGKTIVKRFQNTRAAARLLGGSFKGGFIGTSTMHSDVKKSMRRSAKFKSLTFGDPFYVVPQSAMVGDRRVPALTIKMKKRGRVNRSLN